jgi:hypothetical protein
MQPPASSDGSAPAAAGSFSTLLDPLLGLPPAHFTFALLAAIAALVSFALSLRIAVADLFEHRRSRRFLKAFASSPSSLAPLLRRKELPTCAAVSLYLAALRQIIAMLDLDPDQPDIASRLRSSRLDPARWSLVHDATRASALDLASIWSRGLASARSCLILAFLASALALLFPPPPQTLASLPAFILVLAPALIVAPLASLSQQLRIPRLEGTQLQILATLGQTFLEHASGPALGRPLPFSQADPPVAATSQAATAFDAPTPFSPFDAPAPPSSPSLDPSIRP